MRILVTGGAGFIGSHLVDALLERGDKVVVLDDFSRGHESNISPNVELIRGDVRLEETWDVICSTYKPEIIHHLAAVNGTRKFHREADRVVDVNINGTINAVNAAIKHGSMLIFYSSPEAFGEQLEMPLSNSSSSLFTPANLHQRHSYGSSKYVGEIICQHAARKGLEVRIVRPYNVYGPRLNGGEDGQVVSMMMKSKPIEVHGDGLQTRSFTWIGDLIEGIIKVQDSDLATGSAFNLGTDEEITMLDLANRISLITGSDIVHIKENLGDSRRRVPDLSENIKINWKATTSLNQGLSKSR
ncbi:MAG: NAD-dependent epimerase/dehydratase family protein [Candidatus Poseidoniaceae archaeon]|jgi:nucleoside-diphosphate-sugar epimerase|nr:NAD-dependent epimerase/dehydratase family protein [Candidatus Poseidoniaceae archaeon]